MKKATSAGSLDNIISQTLFYIICFILLFLTLITIYDTIQSVNTLDNIDTSPAQTQPNRKG